MWDSAPLGGPGLLPTLLLTTIGRKSGEARIMPLIYGETADGGYIVIASKGGAPKHPAWYLNLLAQAEVEVQVSDDKFSAQARVASGEERAALWVQQEKLYPPYNDYQKNAGDREIPVIVLDRV
ncbi:MAG: nitroreductase family deazaflavin-dependent oxidoreductase [Porticoccaceae bacterium]|nr:nitroreductase family deazaflavin-dependent oxidoreductase [Porticoccaceae bacterium]